MVELSSRCNVSRRLQRKKLFSIYVSACNDASTQVYARKINNKAINYKQIVAMD